jgi:hypothetical protein
VTVQDKYASGSGRLSSASGRGTWSGYAAKMLGLLDRATKLTSPEDENVSIWNRGSNLMLPDKSIVTNKAAGQCERAKPIGRVGPRILNDPSLRRLPMFRQCARADLRIAYRAAGHGRTDHQPESRKNSRPHAAEAARPSQRDDRMTGRSVARESARRHPSENAVPLEPGMSVKLDAPGALRLVGRVVTGTSFQRLRRLVSGDQIS